ncbi:transglutaminase family protein [Novosphingobium sp. SG720]|uniref:transglutaminase domain-containing protein n=1 Tax=Novosphingobium sp. SG720 TaxID=2586998 RepID=UPI001444BC69|nr:transglutaminase-like putative cysteine protease [Novosphingobium sp. SG720]
MIYDIRHQTRVDYDAPVRLARFNLRLRPAPWPTQSVSQFRLSVSPQPWTMEEEAGPFLVNRSRLFIREPLDRLDVDSTFRVEVTPAAADPAEAVTPSVAEIGACAAAHRDLSALGPASYIYPSAMTPLSPEIVGWAGSILAGKRSVMDAGLALMHAIHDEFTYDGTATTADTPPAEAFRARHGVCQDFAHVMIVAARGHGLPAAYVSGYLRTLPPPGQPRLVGADATHAWAALWCGNELGWVGFDPTNAVLASTDHVFTAMGRDYADVAPMDGVFHGGGGQRLRVCVDVAPVEEPVD